MGFLYPEDVMSKSKGIRNKAGSAAKTATFKARSAVSGRPARKSTSAPIVRGVAAPKNRKVKSVGGKVVPVTSSPAPPTTTPRAPTSPVRQAASDLRLVAAEDVLVAEDATALRVARAVVQHRQGLMDRLAK